MNNEMATPEKYSTTVYTTTARREWLGWFGVMG